MANEGVIVVDLRFRIIGIDSGAEAILRGLTGYDLNVDAVNLPAELRGMLGTWRPSGNGSMKANIKIANVDYSCRVFQVQPLNGVITQAVFALHLNKAVSVTNSLSKVTENYRLTDRESEVLEGISLGLTSKVLADRMNISPNTVNAFLRMIMIKLGVTTRAGIVGKLLEENPVGKGDNVRVLRRGGDNA
jgi:DNA-binding CsgD family transcriptional regulator